MSMLLSLYGGCRRLTGPHAELQLRWSDQVSGTVNKHHSHLLTAILHYHCWQITWLLETETSGRFLNFELHIMYIKHSVDPNKRVKHVGKQIKYTIKQHVTLSCCIETIILHIFHELIYMFRHGLIKQLKNTQLYQQMCWFRKINYLLLKY